MFSRMHFLSCHLSPISLAAFSGHHFFSVFKQERVSFFFFYYFVRGMDKGVYVCAVFKTETWRERKKKKWFGEKEYTYVWGCVINIRVCVIVHILIYIYIHTYNSRYRKKVFYSTQVALGSFKLNPFYLISKLSFMFIYVQVYIKSTYIYMLKGWVGVCMKFSELIWEL